MSSYSVNYSSDYITNTTTNAKYDQTDASYDILLHVPDNEPIVITSDAVFIKPLKLVVMTEDVYVKLKGETNEQKTSD